jgi:glycerol-3-phosphate O-acyltransferase
MYYKITLSNALVLDGETRRLHLKPALDPLVMDDHKEKASVLFLQHHDEKNLLNPPPMPFLRDYCV